MSPVATGGPRGIPAFYTQLLPTVKKRLPTPFSPREGPSGRLRIGRGRPFCGSIRPVWYHPSERATIIGIEALNQSETAARACGFAIRKHPFGHWRSRSVFADLIEFLALGQPRAVVFDVLFTENERGYGVAPGALGPNDARLVAATREGARGYPAFEIHKEEAEEVDQTLLP